MAGKNKITIGERVFAHDEINQGSCYQCVSLLSEALEINYLEAELKSGENLKDLPQDTPLTYFYDGRQVGIFYLQTVKRTGPETYSIYAVSTIGLLEKTDHYGGIYTGQTAEEIVGDICGNVPYLIKSNLKNTKLYGWLPIASRRDNLAQVLFALGAALKTDLDGVLRIEGLWSGISRNIGEDQLYSGGSVDYEDGVSGVAVTEHQFAQGGDSETLFEGTTQQGDMITFSEPMYGLSASGFAILDSGANYAKVSSGSGTLTGRKYIHTQREVTRTVRTGGAENVKTVKEATLVSLVNSGAAADRLANYYRCRETVRSNVVYEGEAAGDRANFYHPYDQAAVPVCLEEVEINLSNVLAAEEKGLAGFAPISIESAVTYESAELLTGEGTWTVPEGVSSIRAVLIGGGGAGEDGESGERAGAGSSQRDVYGTKQYSLAAGQSDTVSSSASCTAGTAGSGGAGGKAGTAGKVFEATLDVSPGAGFAYECGAGGESSGQAGGDTVFGGHSSAGGGVLANGFTDVLTGNTYGKTGIDGSKGGNGGGTGADGEAAGGASGGAKLGGTSFSDKGTYSTSSGQGDTWYGTTNGSVGSAGGGGAGGAAGGTAGSGGKDAYAAASDGSVYYFSVSSTQTTGQTFGFAGGAGGKGADGAAGAAYGCAGSGGGGGGGAGASGSKNVSSTTRITMPSSQSGTSTGTIRAFASVGSAIANPGGAGGAGGSGAAGCVIVYYTRKEVRQSGPVVTKGKRYFVDAKGRRMVV